MFYNKLARADIVALCFCLLTLVYIGCGGLKPQQTIGIEPAQLTLSQPGEDLLSGAGFASNAVYFSVHPPLIKGKVRLYGSWWAQGNTSAGYAQTCWYRPVQRFAIYFVGYPNTPGNQLFVEVETAESGLVRLPITRGENPGEVWRMQEFSLSGVKRPLRFRIVAGDQHASLWFGFSEPFLINHIDQLELLRQYTLALLATVASLTFFLIPGLLLRQKLPNLSPLWIPLAGFSVAALLGLAAWKGPHQIPPDLISRTGITLLVLAATIQCARARFSSCTTRMERRVLLAVTVLAAITVSKSLYSLDPVGDLYAGQISRTLEVGARSDSRISYIMVQLVALRQSGYSQFAKSQFGTWNFSSRGPAAGLAASSVVLSSPVHVLASIPEQPWTLFDPEGFSVYRFSMIVMAAISLVTVYGLARLLLPDEWAFLAFLVTATSPFVVHEIFFTWPKLLSTAFVLGAVYLIARSHFLRAGLCVGAGYLFHPSALLWALGLVAFIIVSAPQTNIAFYRRLWSWGLRTLILCIGIAAAVFFWRQVNRGHFSQEGFLAFFRLTGSRSPGVRNWLLSRWDSLANTFIPLYLYLVNRGDSAVNSIYGPSPTPVKLSFLYWNTLPFGVGIGFFCSGVLCLVRRAFVRARYCALLVFVAPLLFFCAYMGFTTTGMLRDGLQTWFVGLMLFLVVVWQKFGIGSDRLWQVCNWALAERAVEIPAMLTLPSMLSRHYIFETRYFTTDILSLVIILAGCVWMVREMFLHSERLRHEAPYLVANLPASS